MNARQLTSLVLLGAIWGGSFLFMRMTVGAFGAIPLIEIRMIIGALVLLPLMLMKYEWSSITQGLWSKMAIVGIFNTAIPFSLLAYSLHVFTSGMGSVLNATVPMFTAIIAYLWLNEQLTRSRIAGLVIGFIGVLVLVSDKLTVIGSEAGLALIAALLATLSYGFSANYTRRYVVGIDPLVTSTMSLIMGALLLLPFALLSIPASNPSLNQWLSVLVLGAVCTGFAYRMFFRLISEIGATRTVSVTFLIPLFGIVWGALFLQEAVTWAVLLGALIILTGTALSTGVVKLDWFEREQSV